MVPGPSSAIAFEIQVPGATPRIALVTSRSIPDGDGGIAGWVGTLADVTAEVGAEAAMSDARDKATEASRLKSDFLANMSHEIRTPMNGVIGMTDLLLETDLDARQRDYAQTVRNSGEALLTIINDILDFSKVEAGKLEIEDIEFDVRTVVDDVVDLLAGPAQSKGLELVAVIESSVPAVVSGDPGRVRQVLTNLIGNAIKFTQPARSWSASPKPRPASPAETPWSASRSPIRATASRPRSSIRSSSRSSKRTRRPPGGTEARASGSPSAASSSRSWGATAACGAGWASGATSGSRSRVDAVAGQVRDELLSPDAGLCRRDCLGRR